MSPGTVYTGALASLGHCEVYMGIRQGLVVQEGTSQDECCPPGDCALTQLRQLCEPEKFMVLLKRNPGRACVNGLHYRLILELVP